MLGLAIRSRFDGSEVANGLASHGDNHLIRDSTFDQVSELRLARAESDYLEADVTNNSDNIIAP